MEMYKGLYQEVSYRIVGKIGDADIQLIYRIIEKSDPKGFENAVLNCCDMDEIEDRMKEAKKDGQNFYRWIVCNYIESFIYNWLTDIFGTGMSEYFSNLHRGKYNDDIDNYKAGLVYKVFQALDNETKVINASKILSLIQSNKI
jgi:hypothetical protein